MRISPEWLGDRHDIRRQQHLTVILLHAHQRLIERAAAAARIDHRLERRDDAALVQRSHDLVGDADIDATLRVALDIRTPQREPAGAATLGAVQGLRARVTASSTLRA